MVATVMFALPQNAQAQRKEAYVVKSTDETTLTFYYDAKKAKRRGTVWSINRMRTEEMGKFRAAAEHAEHIGYLRSVEVLYPDDLP